MCRALNRSTALKTIIIVLRSTFADFVALCSRFWVPFYKFTKTAVVYRLCVSYVPYIECRVCCRPGLSSFSEQCVDRPEVFFSLLLVASFAISILSVYFLLWFDILVEKRDPCLELWQPWYGFLCLHCLPILYLKEDGSLIRSHLNEIIVVRV